MTVATEWHQGQTANRGRLRVVHILAALRPSGAERMLQCSFREWQRHSVEPVIVGFSDQPHPFAQEMRCAGYETLLLTRNSRTVGGLAALRSALAGLRPDIVHVHNESMFPLICALAQTTPGVQGVVRSIHTNFRYHGLLAPRRILFSRAAAALGVVSVACGQGVADNEERRYRHRPRVVENWVDVGAFPGDLDDHRLATRHRLGLAQADFVAMILGNCEPAKRHFLVLEAIAALRHPVVLLHVGGEERADEAERSRWQQIVAPHRLIRLGPRGDVATLLAAADVLAMPSDPGEGFGLAAAESLCAGTPVIASAAPGLAWVTDFRTGRTVEWNAAAWADELERAVAHGRDPEWEQARHEDATIARRRFSPERGVSEWRQLYDLAAGSR